MFGNKKIDHDPNPPSLLKKVNQDRKRVMEEDRVARLERMEKA